MAREGDDDYRHDEQDNRAGDGQSGHQPATVVPFPPPLGRDRSRGADGLLSSCLSGCQSGRGSGLGLI